MVNGDVISHSCRERGVVSGGVISDSFRVTAVVRDDVMSHSLRVRGVVSGGVISHSNLQCKRC